MKIIMIVKITCWYGCYSNLPHQLLDATSVREQLGHLCVMYSKP